MDTQQAPASQARSRGWTRHAQAAAERIERKRRELGAARMNTGTPAPGAELASAGARDQRGRCCRPAATVAGADQVRCSGYLVRRTALTLRSDAGADVVTASLFHAHRTGPDENGIGP